MARPFSPAMLLRVPLALPRLPRARLRRRPAVAPLPATDAPGATLAFRCNLCGADNRAAPETLDREVPSCRACASTVRFRAIAHLVVREVLGVEAALPDLARRRDIAGLGLSDAPAYARPLARAFDYTNTWLHRRPRLDITDVPARLRGRYRFVVASEVFEHVAPPVARAFAGLRSLLAPGGVVVFTAPFGLQPRTVEHYPELHDWRLERLGSEWTLHNVTADGREQRFDRLVFHGGPGSTLEMRVFARDELLGLFAAAGFARVRIADEACPSFGIAWRTPWSLPIVAHAD
jgi:hypothetical protein